LPQPLQERCETCPSLWTVLNARECADAAYVVRLLRARDDRPCSCGSRTADKRDEIPPLHLPPVTTTPSKSQA
jgi:hypothetical protein